MSSQSVNTVSRVDRNHITHYGGFVQEPTTIQLGRDDDGRRADRVVRKVLKSVPLSTIYRLFRQKRVKIGERVVGADERLKSGDILNLSLPHNLIEDSISGHLEPLLSFDETVLARLPEQPRVLWENEHLVALHKPRGMLTHDGTTSLESFVRNYLRDRLPPSASFIPGPLHRLDRNTSGIVMFSKSRMGAEVFSKELSSHRIRKFYIAIVNGKIEESVTLEDRFCRDQHQRQTITTEHGRYGKLHLIPIAVKDGATLVFIELYTGLTHQIRAQLAAHGHALKGDIKYGNNEKMNSNGYFLHAHTLVIPQIFSLEIPKVLSDPLPQDFQVRAVEIFGSNIIQNNCCVEGDFTPNFAIIDEYILKAIEDMI